MFSTSTRSLRSHLLRALVAPLVFAAVSVGVVALGTQAEVGEVAETPATPSRAAVLMERHGCWSGEAPADMVGVFPSHAVVTWPGDVVPSYGGRRAASVALEHVFGNERRGMTVHGFCR